MKKIILIALSLAALTACSNHNEESDSSKEHKRKPIAPVCSAPAMPQNIWKLEPILKDKGLITEEMSKEQKEKVIRDYITKRNSAYIEKCEKGNKS